MKEKNSSEGLKRQLKPMHVWALAFGCVVGWGSFINPGKKFLPNSGVAGTAIAMIMGALVMIVIAFSYAYMVPKFPKAGGEFTFTKACFGKTAAYICGWFLVAALGLAVSAIFMILQLVPIPGLEGVHFGKESYMLLIVWVLLGVIFYLKQIKSLKEDKTA